MSECNANTLAIRLTQVVNTLVSELKKLRCEHEDMMTEVRVLKGIMKEMCEKVDEVWTTHLTVENTMQSIESAIACLSR